MSAYKDWYAFNQAYLSAAIAEVRQCIVQYQKGKSKRKSKTISRTNLIALPSANEQTAIEILCYQLQLSAFERKVLLLCAGIELDQEFAALCASAQENEIPYPTIGFLLELFEGDFYALSTQASLRYWGLVEIISASAFVMSRCKLAESILYYLKGNENIDEALTWWLKYINKNPYSLSSHLIMAEQIVQLWSHLPIELPRPLLQLTSNHLNNIENIAMLACQQTGFILYRLEVKSLPANLQELQQLQRLLTREALLKNIIYLLIFEDLDNNFTQQSGIALAKQLNSRCIIATQQPLPILDYPVVNFEVKKLTTQEQLQIWKTIFPTAFAEKLPNLADITAQFDFSTSQIQSVCSTLLAQSTTLQAKNLSAEIWQLCRTQARKSLNGLVQFIDCKASWENLILPEMQQQALKEIVLHVAQRYKVYQEWGFAEKSARGLGISALFAGPSGTGKTLAAEVLAKELQTDLYQIDLSAIISKYIGETEKNLQKIFDAAETDGAILLFDEADALFGKRSDVKDSHDRYANIEVSYLLQRIEAYRGLSILTTNAKSILDNAFLRRIRFIIHFNFPDQDLRAHIWQQIFPVAMPMHNLDFNKLARLNLAGGNIRNIALNAAFVAANTNQPVSMQHLLHATRNEYLKLGKTLTAKEIEDWA